MSTKRKRIRCRCIINSVPDSNVAQCKSPCKKLRKYLDRINYRRAEILLPENTFTLVREISSEPQAIDLETILIVREFIAGLSEQQKVFAKAVLLFGFTVAEVARNAGISRSSARIHMRRLLSRIKRDLEPNEASLLIGEFGNSTFVPSILGGQNE